MAVDVNGKKRDVNGGKMAPAPAKTEDKVRDIDAARALGLSTGWGVFSYLLAGMAAYGAIGWGIGKAVHVSLLFPVGMMVGLAISVGYVIYRYGRQGSVEQELRRATAGGGNDR